MDSTKVKGPSKIRRIYIAKLIGRCIILLFGFWLCWKHIEIFKVLDNFFGEFSILHILWVFSAAYYFQVNY